ncbi:MFS transporter [Nocardioides dilutus]
MSEASAFAPLREPNFRYYFFSRLVNLVGSVMAGVALAFAVLEVSNSATALGTVLAAHSIPMVVFLLAGGVIADRFGRTLIIQVSNVVSGLCQLAIAALVISGEARLWQLIVLTAIQGTVSSVSFPALASVLPQMVPRDQLKQANLLVSVQRNALTVVGPAVSGVLVVTVGAGWALAVDGATYLLAAALLIRVRIPPPLPRADRPGAVAELREGWDYFRATTWLWVIVLAFGALNMIQSGALHTLGPVLAKNSDIGENGWGLILSAEALGFLLCSFALMRLPLRRPLRTGMIAVSLLGLPMLALGFEPVLAAGMVGAFLGGVGTEVFGLGWNLAMQENVPDEMLSRAYSYDALGSFVAIPLGQLAFGPLGQVFGIQDVMLVSGVAYLVICAVTLLSRSVRNLPRVTEPVSTTSPPAH